MRHKQRQRGLTLYLYVLVRFKDLVRLQILRKNVENEKLRVNNVTLSELADECCGVFARLCDVVPLRERKYHRVEQVFLVRQRFEPRFERIDLAALQIELVCIVECLLICQVFDDICAEGVQCALPQQRFERFVGRFDHFLFRCYDDVLN